MPDKRGVQEKQIGKVRAALALVFEGIGWVMFLLFASILIKLTGESVDPDDSMGIAMQNIAAQSNLLERVAGHLLGNGLLLAPSVFASAIAMYVGNRGRVLFLLSLCIWGGVSVLFAAGLLWGSVILVPIGLALWSVARKRIQNQNHHNTQLERDSNTPWWEKEKGTKDRGKEHQWLDTAPTWLFCLWLVALTALLMKWFVGDFL